MRYIIQRFVPSDPDWKSSQEPLVGQWRNTNWGSDERDIALQNAKDALASGNFAGIRVVELLFEKWHEGAIKHDPSVNASASPDGEPSNENRVQQRPDR